MDYREKDGYNITEVNDKELYNIYYLIWYDIVVYNHILLILSIVKFILLWVLTIIYVLIILVNRVKINRLLLIMIFIVIISDYFLPK